MLWWGRPRLLMHELAIHDEQSDFASSAGGGLAAIALYQPLRYNARRVRGGREADAVRAHGPWVATNSGSGPISEIAITDAVVRPPVAPKQPPMWSDWPNAHPGHGFPSNHGTAHGPCALVPKERGFTPRAITRWEPASARAHLATPVPNCTR